MYIPLLFILMHHHQMLVQMLLTLTPEAAKVTVKGGIISSTTSMGNTSMEGQPSGAIRHKGTIDLCASKFIHRSFNRVNCTFMEVQIIR